MILLKNKCQKHPIIWTVTWEEDLNMWNGTYYRNMLKNQQISNFWYSQKTGHLHAQTKKQAKNAKKCWVILFLRDGGNLTKNLLILQ